MMLEIKILAMGYKRTRGNKAYSEASGLSKWKDEVSLTEMEKITKGSCLEGKFRNSVWECKIGGVFWTSKL